MPRRQELLLGWGVGIALCLRALVGSAQEPAPETPAREAADVEPRSSDRAYHPAPSAHPTAAPRALTVEAPAGAEVVVVPIADTVEMGLSAFVERALREHEDAAAFVLDINTFGGRVDAAVRIRDALLAAERPTVAFIHPRAISAGALIALACDRILIAGGGTVGAATPFSTGGAGTAEQVEEKMISYMRTEMRATAEENGRRGDIAEAMVDPDVEIEGVIERGKLLTLDTDRALALGIADARADDLDAALALLGLADRGRVVEEENWGEEVARVLTEPTVSGLLLSVGMLSILATIYTGSFGVLTAVGLLALALFFGGHATVHLVGWEEAALFVVGVALLAVEVFVLPGFGVAGVAGIALVVVSLVMSFLSLPIDISWETGLLFEAVGRVAASMLATLLMAVLFVRLFPHTPVGRRLVHAGVASREQGYVGAPPAAPELVGREGEALTPLRPSGKVLLGAERHDAISERAYIDEGRRVRVVRVAGAELVVREVEEGGPA